MIVGLRTGSVPAAMHERYRGWIGEGRAVREAHGILAELVCEPTDGDGDTVVVTIWPAHATFDAWIATAHRDAVTVSVVHQAVDYHPMSRDDVAAGYLNLGGIGVAGVVRQEQQ